MDQATLEMFVAVLLDENDNSEGQTDRAFEFGSGNSEEDLSRQEDDPQFTTEEDQPCIKLQVQQVWNNIQEADEESSVFLVNESLPGTSLAVGLSKK